MISCLYLPRTPGGSAWKSTRPCFGIPMSRILKAGKRRQDARDGRPGVVAPAQDALHGCDLYDAHAGRVFQEKGCLDRRLAALGTICEILDEESKDPFEKAHAHAELGCAEATLGINSCFRLAKALTTLRKRPRGITARAASSLASQLRPAKRLMRKTHPEEMMT